QRDKNDQDTQKGQREPGDGAEEALRLPPACSKRIANAQRDNRAQDLAAHIPEQKRAIGIAFSPREPVYRSPKHDNEPAREKNSPACPPLKVRAAPRQRLRREKTPVSLFDPGQQWRPYLPPEHIAHGIPQDSRADRHGQEKKKIEIAESGERARSVE